MLSTTIGKRPSGRGDDPAGPGVLNDRLIRVDEWECARAGADLAPRVLAATPQFESAVGRDAVKASSCEDLRPVM